MKKKQKDMEAWEDSTGQIVVVVKEFTGWVNEKISADLNFYPSQIILGQTKSCWVISSSNEFIHGIVVRLYLVGQ